MASSSFVLAVNATILPPPLASAIPAFPLGSPAVHGVALAASVPHGTHPSVLYPKAILLMGMPYADVVKVQDFLQNMGGDFMKVIICTKEMMKGTLWDAMNTSQLQLKEVKAVNNAPRICFLSGLTGEEIVMFVDAFPEASIGSVVFAALVPNNAQKSVEELVEEVMGDHERLTQNR